jgi:hypothetical protein
MFTLEQWTGLAWFYALVLLATVSFATSDISFESVDTLTV